MWSWQCDSHIGMPEHAHRIRLFSHSSQNSIIMNIIKVPGKDQTRDVEIRQSGVDHYDISLYSVRNEPGIDIQKLVIGFIFCLLGFVFLGVSVGYQEDEGVRKKTFNYYVATFVCLVCGTGFIYKAYYDRYRMLDDIL